MKAVTRQEIKEAAIDIAAYNTVDDKLVQHCKKPTGVKYDTKIREEYHPIANLEPMMQEAELDLLVASMQRKGFDKSKPITMYEDRILDGRNRYVAAKYLDIEPVTTEFTGTYEEAIAESEDLNNARRHKSPSQKAMAAAYTVQTRRESRALYRQELLEVNPKMDRTTLSLKIGKKYPKISTKDAAKRYGANAKYIGTCLTYLNEINFDLTEMTELIFDGKMDLATARHRYRELKEAFVITGHEQQAYTDEELLIFEMEDMAKNNPRSAALEIVTMRNTLNELRAVIVDQDDKIEALEDIAAEVSVLRSTINNIQGPTKETTP